MLPSNGFDSCLVLICAEVRIYLLFWVETPADESLRGFYYLWVVGVPQPVSGSLTSRFNFPRGLRRDRGDAAQRREGRGSAGRQGRLAHRRVAAWCAR